MTNETQEERVLQQLREKGYVSRNWALNNYISRLGAIIYTLKSKGYDIVGFYNTKGFYGRNKNDYIYFLKNQELLRYEDLLKSILPNVKFSDKEIISTFQDIIEHYGDISEASVNNYFSQVRG